MGDSPPNPQPIPDDPWLDGLTFEQVAQLVTEVDPEVFHRRAAAFDQAGARMQDALDQVRREMNAVREVWTGKAADDFDAVVREVTAKVSGALQYLHSPGYGATLRAAADRLADHQRRLRDLQGQKAQQESAPPVDGGPSPEETAKLTGDSAKQILRDLRMAYWEVGNALPVLPYKAPQVVADTTALDKGNVVPGGNNQPVVRTAVTDPNGGGSTETPGPVLGLRRPDGSGFGFDSGGRHGSGGSGGSGGFGGSGGQDVLGHDTQVLGRGDSSGPGWVPIGPGAVFAANQVDPTGQAVIGQRCAPVSGDQTGGSRRGNGPDAAPLGVLGRPAGRAGGTDPGAKCGQTSKADKNTPDTRDPLDLRRDVVDDLVEQDVRTEIEGKPVAEKQIRTAVEPPLVVAGETAARIAATSGPPLVAGQDGGEQGFAKRPLGGLDIAAVAPAATPGALPVDAGTEVDRVFAASSSERPGGVVQAFAPEARGAEVLRVPGEVVAGPVAPGPVGPSSSAPVGGFPMGPMMMGGMGMGMGGPSPQGGRMSAVPNESRPELWDPVTGEPLAVGRREPQREREPCESQQTLSKDEVQARFAEKLAELDRLTERKT